ncbi:hypothetical protein, partial [Isoptericola haloaureus]
MRRDLQRLPHGLEAVLGHARQAADAPAERDAARLEVADGRQALLEAVGVHEHHGTDRAPDQV